MVRSDLRLEELRAQVAYLIPQHQHLPRIGVETDRKAVQRARQSLADIQQGSAVDDIHRQLNNKEVVTQKDGAVHQEREQPPHMFDIEFHNLVTSELYLGTNCYLCTGKLKLDGGPLGYRGT